MPPLEAGVELPLEVEVECFRLQGSHRQAPEAVEEAGPPELVSPSVILFPVV